MRTESEKAAQKRYSKKTIKRIQLDLNQNTDKDIIEWIASKPSTAGTIKALIREQIEREKKEK